MTTDAIHHPAHYTAYPVQPIAIARHLGFCLGNAVKYVLRAPYKGGAEDCAKALKYLGWERERQQSPICVPPYLIIHELIERLSPHLRSGQARPSLDLVMRLQAHWLDALRSYLMAMPEHDGYLDDLERLTSELAEAIRAEQAEISEDQGA